MGHMRPGLRGFMVAPTGVKAPFVAGGQDGVHCDQDYRKGCRMTSAAATMAGATIDVDIREAPQKPGFDYPRRYGSP